MRSVVLLALLCCAAGFAAESKDILIHVDELKPLLNQYRSKREGALPDNFCVRISLHPEGQRIAINEVYEFTPTIVRQLRATESNVDGVRTFEVAGERPFTKIDDVCRILLALDYPELCGPRAHTDEKNLNYLQVLTGCGMKPMGGAVIKLSSGGKSIACCESCLFAGFATSAQSIRFGALYHSLRNLARGELGLAEKDWLANAAETKSNSSAK